MITAALIAALALSGGLSAMLFWQLKRSAKAVDGHIAGVQASAELQILLAASGVALADKERALNLVTAERDRLEFTIDVVEEQRDALLKESLDQETPGSTAIAVRNALTRLHPVETEVSEAHSLPDLSGP
jgi:hypothetical protein